MSILADSMRECGYSLSGSTLTTNLLLYADDACVVANGPASGQMLLNQVERWLNWTGMKAKVPKCCSLALQSSTAKMSDPALSLQGQQIPYTNTQPVRFLGGNISIPANVHRQKKNLSERLETLLERVDGTLVTGLHQLTLLVFTSQSKMVALVYLPSLSSTRR